MLAALASERLRPREDGWITVEEAAAAWKVSNATARRRLQDRGWATMEVLVGKHKATVYRPA